MSRSQIERDAVLRNVLPYLNNDWRIEEESQEYFTLSKSEATLQGHLVVFLLLGWWMLFIPNIIYHLSGNKTLKIPKRK